jgi:hypothetical protein
VEDVKPSKVEDEESDGSAGGSGNSDDDSVYNTLQLKQQFESYLFIITHPYYLLSNILILLCHKTSSATAHLTRFTIDTTFQ